MFGTTTYYAGIITMKYQRAVATSLIPMRFTSNQAPKYDNMFNRNMFGNMAVATGGIAYGIYFFSNKRKHNQLNHQWHLYNDLVPVAHYFDQYIKRNDKISFFVGKNIRIVPDSWDVTIDGNNWIYGWFDCDKPHIDVINKRPVEQKIIRALHPDGESGETVICEMKCSFKVTGDNDKVATIKISNEYAKYTKDYYFEFEIVVIDEESGEITRLRSIHPSTFMGFMGRVARFDDKSPYYRYNHFNNSYRLKKQ
eukprot:389634_1